MGMNVRRRGQVYSLVVILMSIPILLFLTYYMTSVQTMKFGTSERVIADQLKETGRSIEEDFARAIEISGIRACLGTTDYMIREGMPLDSAELRMEELILNGTLFGNQTYVMLNNTIDDWRDKIYSITPGFNVLLEYSNFSIQNYNGFHLLAGIRLYFNISDKLNTAKISKDVSKSVLIPLENIEDPIFPYNTNGVASRGIRFYPYTYHAIKIVTGSSSSDNCSGNVTYDPLDPAPANKILVTDNASGITGFAGVVGEYADTPSISCYIVGASSAIGFIQTLLNQSDGWVELYLDQNTNGVWSLPINDALENGYYTRFDNSSGPNLMQRLEGSLNETTNGIETFVNIPDFQGWGVPVKTNQISLAYLYFRSTTHTGIQVRGLPDWFRINSTYADRYNLTELM
jgi:hypothetical protein